MFNESHPLCDALTEETNIWKYLDIPSFLSIIQEQKLTFSKVSEMEDRFEGEIPPLTQKDIIYWYRKYFKKGDEISSASIEEFKSITNNSYLSCWNINDYEIVHMWKLYSKEVGLAIKTNYAKLRKSFDCEEEHLIIPTKINYIDFNNDNINYNNNVFTPLKYKRREYIYENEFRLIIPANGLGTKDTTIKCKIDLSNFIDEIKLSPFAPKWYKPIIQDLLIKYGLSDIEVQQSDL